MSSRKDPSDQPLFSPGEVLALFTPLQEMETGLYLLYAVTDGWIVLRGLIDDEQADRLLITNREARLPVTLLRLFMPIGLQLSIDDPPRLTH